MRAFIEQPFDEGGLVHVVAARFAQGAEGLDADGKSARGIAAAPPRRGPPAAPHPALRWPEAAVRKARCTSLPPRSHASPRHPRRQGRRPPRRRSADLAAPAAPRSCRTAKVRAAQSSSCPGSRRAPPRDRLVQGAACSCVRCHYGTCGVNWRTVAIVAECGAAVILSVPRLSRTNCGRRGIRGTNPGAPVSRETDNRLPCADQIDQIELLIVFDPPAG